MKKWGLGIILAFGGLLSFFIAAQAIQTTEATGVSWVTESPTVAYSEPSTGMTSSYCNHPRQMLKIGNTGEYEKVCLMTNGTIKYGNYFDGHNFNSVIGFPNDNKMYNLQLNCPYKDSCLYLVETDVLVMKRHIVNNIVFGLVAFKDFSKRIEKTINPQNFNTVYAFDDSDPDYTFQDGAGYAWPVESIKESDGGRWVAVEMRERGIGLLDTESFAMKRITTDRYRYGWGMNPSVEFAVSQGGHQVAAVGQNAGIRVYEINDSCGDFPTDDQLRSNTAISNPCRESPIRTDDFISRFRSAVLPTFNGSGSSLSFYATSYTGETRHVELRASGYEGPRLDYLALGDSFTSGEGEIDDAYYIGGTNDKNEKCHVSTRSYPFVISNMIGIESDYMKSVACSGATTKDIIGLDSGYWGQGNRLDNNGLALDKTDKSLFQNEALDSFIPGRVHQESFVKEYQPDVITIGVGGNDVGFMQKLKACLGPDTCTWADTAKGKEQTAIEIKNLFDVLVNTYKEINKASPSSKVYSVGYPKIISTNGQCRNPLVGYLFDETEREFMDNGIEYINDVIAAASQSAGVRYIDVEDSYDEYVLCGDKFPGAMSAIRIGDDYSPIDKLSWFKVVGQESFHPNLLGHALVSSSIIEDVGDIVAYHNCTLSAKVCPDDTILAPEPSSYWVSDGLHGYPTQKSMELIAMNDDGVYKNHKSLALESFTLQPDSRVEVEINSTPRQLGVFKSASDGSLVVDIDLPVDLEEGFHTVHVYGTSYAGDAVDLYQVIEHRLETEQQQSLVPNNSSSDSIDGSNIDGLVSGNPYNNQTKHDIPTLLSDEVGSINSKVSLDGDSDTRQEVKGASTAKNSHTDNRGVGHLWGVGLVAVVILVIAFGIIKLR